MKKFLAIACMSTALPLCADTHYVAITNTSPLTPYGSWIDAATNIQDAVDIAADGDLVLVADGVYSNGAYASEWGSQTNRLVLPTNRFIRVESVNGPEHTVICGQPDPDTGGCGSKAVRCVYMGSGILSGFTVTNGYTIPTSADISCGGGLYGAPGTVSKATNCIIIHNRSFNSGGGIFRINAYDCIISSNISYYTGGGAYVSELHNCTVSDNKTPYGSGGGIYSSDAYNCTISGNVADGYGGGVYAGMVSNCVIEGNTCTNYGGGIFAGSPIDQVPPRFGSGYDCIISNNVAANGGGIFGRGPMVNDPNPEFPEFNRCIIVNNEATYGGGVYRTAIMKNCLIANNKAKYGGGSYYYGRLLNCTVTGNRATRTHGGANRCIASNTIFYANTAKNSFPNIDLSQISFGNCLAPEFSGGTNGNISGDPGFINTAADDFRLQASSPCINAGTNYPGIGTIDLAGHPRIVNKFPDIGAYEYIASETDFDGDGLSNTEEEFTHGSSPTDSDTDSDGQSDPDEVVAGTILTNANSYFCVEFNEHSTPDGYVIEWESVSNRLYSVYCSTNLITGFYPMTNNIPYPQNSYTDTVHSADRSCFYKLTVELDD